ncbi:MAG: DUF89 family protein [Bacteroidales bacterium]|nr:DUF89 family protein [Bacteroidales bacterium]
MTTRKAMRPECYFCHIKTIQNLIEKFNPDDNKASELIFSIHEILGENKDLRNPELATLIHRQAKAILKNEDLYNSEKRMVNQTLLKWSDYWNGFIRESKDSFATAAKLAVVGNIIDYGAHSLRDNLLEQIHALNEVPLKIDETKELREALNKAKLVLYLGDNAGEVFFDRLFIEQMQHPNIFFATRGKPVINDVIKYDALEVGIDQVSTLISNGYDAPSTLLEYCSVEFREIYSKADLIISKGQGNFEGLMNEGHPDTYFMLIAKCKPMADMLEVEANDMVIRKLKYGEKAL